MSEAVQSAESQVEGVETAEAEEQTFTQADLNKIAANEKRAGSKSGRAAAIAELLERTGAESIDDVLSSYEEYKSVREATVTEADRAREKAQELEKRAKAAEERYSNTLREFAVRDALRDSGINSARLPLALKVADMQELEVAEDGTIDGVESVVEALKEASPEWFAAEPRQRTNAPQTSGGGPSVPKGAQAEIQAAIESGDFVTAERLHAEQLAMQGKLSHPE